MPKPSSPIAASSPTHPATFESALALVDGLFAEQMHAARVVSLANATLGVIQSGSLAIHAIGRGLAATRALCDKHAVKQIDRLVGNENLKVAELLPRWSRHLLAGCDEAFVNMDWTDFDDDGQSMLVLSLQTHHGRAMPLMWRTVLKAELKDRRSGIERDLLTAFKSAVPEQSRITVVADRGFGDIKLYEHLNSLGFAYVIRFRSNITITSANGTTKPARDWLDGKRLRVLMPAMLTAKRFSVGRVLIVHDAAMKDCWCLAIKDHDPYVIT